METAAEGQLRFAIDYDATGAPASSVDLVEAYLAVHSGDARAAIRELLADADFLRDQLYTASCIMSQGISRGWRPKYERV